MFKKNQGFATVEYIVGAGVVATLAVAAFIYILLPAEEAVVHQQPDTYHADYYRTK
ncbi:MAG TPA: hypothetical protein VF199_04580 [Bacillales bacterium]